jgi:hypothetical protein
MNGNELFVEEHTSMLMDNLLKGADTDVCQAEWCLFQH